MARIGSRLVGWRSSGPTAPVTPSMRRALADLDLDRIVAVHAGDDAPPLAERIDAAPAARLLVDGWAATALTGRTSAIRLPSRPRDSLVSDATPHHARSA